MTQDWTEFKDVSFFVADLGDARTKMGIEGRTEDLGLFNNNKQRILEMDKETLGSILLNCGCSSNMASVGWWSNYFDTRPLSTKRKVKVSPSDGKKFRFRGAPCKKVGKIPRQTGQQEHHVHEPHCQQ